MIRLYPINIQYKYVYIYIYIYIYIILYISNTRPVWDLSLGELSLLRHGDFGGVLLSAGTTILTCNLSVAFFKVTR